MRCVGLFLSVMLEAQRSKCCNPSHLIPHQSLRKAWWEGDWRGMGTQCTVCVRACVHVCCSAVWSCDCYGSAPHVSSVWVIQRVQDFLLMCSYLYARAHVYIRCTVCTQLIAVTQSVVCLLQDISDAWYGRKTNRLQRPTEELWVTKHDSWPALSPILVVELKGFCVSIQGRQILIF